MLPEAALCVCGCLFPLKLPSESEFTVFPLSAAAVGPSSTPTPQHTTPPHRLWTEAGAPPPKDPLTAFSSQPARTVQDARSTTLASTVRPQSEFLASAQPTTTGYPLTPATGRGPVGTRHQEVPSELNVGDEGEVMDRLFKVCWMRYLFLYSTILPVIQNSRGPTTAPLPLWTPYWLVCCLCSLSPLLSSSSYSSSSSVRGRTTRSSTGCRIYPW